MNIPEKTNSSTGTPRNKFRHPGFIVPAVLGLIVIIAAPIVYFSMLATDAGPRYTVDQVLAAAKTLSPECSPPSKS